MKTMKWIEWLQQQESPIKADSVAKILGITPAHVYKLAKAGLIPGTMRLSAKAIRFCPMTLLPWVKEKVEGHGKDC